MSVFIRSNLGQSNISDPISSSHPTEHWTQEAAHRIIIRSLSELQQHYYFYPKHSIDFLTNDSLVIPDQVQVVYCDVVSNSPKPPSSKPSTSEREEDNLNPDRYWLPLLVWRIGMCKWDYSGWFANTGNKPINTLRTCHTGLTNNLKLLVVSIQNS